MENFKTKCLDTFLLLCIVTNLKQKDVNLKKIKKE